MNEKELEELGCPKDTLKRLKWLKEKIKEEDAAIKEALESWDKAEDMLDEPIFKEASKENIKRLREEGEIDIEAMLLEYILELRTYLQIARIRIAALEEREERVKKLSSQMNTMFGSANENQRTE